ncbi:MAG: serine/threonine-protein kinase [Elainellaceae cyanobacterium]
MSYCLTSGCLKPFNSSNAKFCLACGSRLLLGDRYRAVQPIGTGQGSRTFLGIDSRRIVDNRCIIKAFSARRGVEAFRVEAERLEQVRQHPQLPDLLAYFERGEIVYLVQEFVDGLSLQQALKAGGAFTAEQIRQLLLETLPLLKFLHDRHIIHRDLKPSNLMRRRSDGVLMLVDIGSAKYATATSLNKTGTLVGSAEYAPLEQLMGRAIFASDLYSLGVTCVHLLTGLSPFELFNPTDGRWLWRSVSGPVSSSLETVLNGLLQRDISQRYRSVDAVWADLDKEFGARGSAQASQRPSTSIPAEIPPSHKGSEAEPTHPTWIQEQVLRHDGGINAMALTPDGRILVTGGNDARICLWDMASGLCVYTLKDHGLAISALAISADGRTLASSSWDQTLRLWDLHSATPQQQMQATQREITALALACLGAARIAPDMQSPGQSILISAGRGQAGGDAPLNVWNISTGKAIAQFKSHKKAIEAIALSPHQPSHQPILASGDAEGRVNIWHLGTHERLRTLSKHQASVNAIAIRADREAIATGSADTTIRLRQINTGGSLHVLKGHLLPISALAFSSNLPYLASGSYDSAVRIWHLDTGDCVQTLEGHSQPIVAIALTTQNTLISASRDGAIHIWRCSSHPL